MDYVNKSDIEKLLSLNSDFMRREYLKYNMDFPEHLIGDGKIEIEKRTNDKELGDVEIVRIGNYKCYNFLDKKNERVGLDKELYEKYDFYGKLDRENQDLLHNAVMCMQDGAYEQSDKDFDEFTGKTNVKIPHDLKKEFSNNLTFYVKNYLNKINGDGFKRKQAFEIADKNKNLIKKYSDFDSFLIAVEGLKDLYGLTTKNIDLKNFSQN